MLCWTTRCSPRPLADHGELAGLAERTATDAEKLLGNARRALRRADTNAVERAAIGAKDPAAGRRRGRLRRALNDLAGLLEAIPLHPRSGQPHPRPRRQPDLAPLSRPALRET
jgi:hypothetical protein